VLGKQHYHFHCCICLVFLLFFDRCQGHRKDLDGELSKISRSRELTERLVEDSLVKTLWDDYGIVADTVVRIRYFLLCMIVNSIQYLAFYK
jgi:hypothetical protein